MHIFSIEITHNLSKLVLLFNYWHSLDKRFTMTSNSNIDYVKTNFEYSVLTKVQGSPTYESLKKIKDELEANAATVPSDLGGGGHEHLRLVLTTIEYNFIFGDPLC